MRRSPWLLACTLALSLPALSLTGGAVRAQATPVSPLERSDPSVLSPQDTGPPLDIGDLLPTPPPAASPKTLAQALVALEAPKQDLFLTVGADKVRLPPGASLPDPDSRPGSVGAAYGRLIRDFGGVMALAPPEMVVLNTHPGVPDPYDGLPPEAAFKLLTSTLSEDQWRMLTSETGLGDADLITDTQHADFAALFPTGEVTATYLYVPLVSSLNLPPVKLNGPDLKAARLRLVQRVEVTIPGEGGRGGARYQNTALDPSLNWYEGFDSGERPDDAPAYGVTLRETLPNNPKDADLDSDAPALTRSVRLDGIVTVGDLVARVGQAAGLELYADRRYETRRVTLVGRRTARAVDLLRAAAFCVTGTFRRVGPAYVLTDDLQGTIPRRQRLTRLMQEADMRIHAVLEAAGDRLATTHGGADALPSFDGLGLSAAQKALPGYSHDLTSASLDLPFDQLSPAQQEYARHQVAQVNREAVGGFRLTVAGTFHLRTGPGLLLLSPAVPGPMVFLSGSSLYQPSFRLLDEIADKRQRESLKAARKLQEVAVKADPLLVPSKESRAAYPYGYSIGRGKPGITPLLPLATLMASIPRRAFLAHPRTAAEVDSVVASMKKIGLNQLWLDVFSGGHSYLNSDGGPDILAEALARTKGTGIAIIPALDLLRWGSDAPAGALDLTAFGETSVQAQAWQQRLTNVMMDVPPDAAAQTAPADIWVSPAAPGVERTLLTLVRRLAATPGVTTLALRGTAPPYYENGNFGYIPALRLALLRRAHVDPIDLSTDTTLSGADVSLPDFEDAQAVNPAMQEWDGLRTAANRDLLRRLLAAAQDASGQRFRFLVQQRGKLWVGDWYGLWDDPQAPLPEAPRDPPPPAPGRPAWERDYAPGAHSQCRVNMTVLLFGPLLYRYDLAADLQFLPPGWDGVVVEADSNQLAKLTPSATP